MKRFIAFIVPVIVFGVGGWLWLRQGALKSAHSGLPQTALAKTDALSLRRANSQADRRSGSPTVMTNVVAPIRPGLSKVAKRAWDAAFLPTLKDLRKGDPIGFPLAGDLHASGTIGNILKRGPEVVYVSGQLTQPEKGRFFFQRQSMAGVAGDFVGVVEFPSSERAYRVEPTGENGAPELVERPLKEVLCLYLPPPVQGGAGSNSGVPMASPSDYPDRPIPPYQNGVPVLESLPGSKAVIYLDFGGGFDVAWGGIAYAQPNVNSAQIRDVWCRVTEDFLPFDINVTTDLAVFQRAPPNGRQHVIITPTTTAAPGQGGVAYIGSFNWTLDVPCWVFTLSGNGCAQACSHEVGHTLGLMHQGQEHNGVLHDYYSGHGTGETSWAPIMGLPYYANVTQWSKGEYLYANNQEDELAIITTRNNNLTYRPDEIDNGRAASRFLEVHLDGTVHGEGVIERTDGVAAFQFATSGGKISLAALPACASPNLAVQVALYDSADNLLLWSNPDATLCAGLATNLPAGTYSFQVAAAGRHFSPTNGFSSYGSLGYYSITGYVAQAQSTYRFNIPQYNTNGSVVGVVGPLDGAGDGLVYTIGSGDDAHLFAIDNFGTLSLRYAAQLDYYAAASQPCVPVVLELAVSISGVSNSTQGVISCRVLVEIDYQASPPLIREQPETQTISAGSDVILAVSAVGDAPLSYQWFFNGTPMAGWTSPYLLLNDAQASNAGEYSVCVSNVLGVVTSATARLSVTQATAPVIVKQPLDQLLEAGDTLLLTVAASGTPALRYQWQKGGTALAEGTSTSLVIANAARRDSGAYAVKVSNDSGSTLSRSAAVRVRVPQQLSGWEKTAEHGFVLLSEDFNKDSLLPGDVSGFVLQVSQDLKVWQSVSNQVVLTNGMLLLRDLEATNHSVRYYRVQERLPSGGMEPPALPWLGAEP